MKYLGVIIDTKLNWISHITFVKNKVAKGIGIIRRARPLLNKSALRNLYHTFIYPYLTYCVEVWGSGKSVHLSPILLLKKKMIRLITFSERLAHTEPIFLQLNILPIDKLIQDRIGLFMYKCFMACIHLLLTTCILRIVMFITITLEIEIIFMFLWHIVTCMPKVFIVQVS